MQFAALVLLTASLTSQASLPGTQPLDWTGDLSARMVEGIDQFLLKQIDASASGRSEHWKRDFSSLQAFEQSIESNRQRLRKIIGAVDPLTPGRLEQVTTISRSGSDSVLAMAGNYIVRAVRWPTFPGVYGEGLLLQPKEAAKACAVLIPDADQVPEDLVFAKDGVDSDSLIGHRLASSGIEVLIPTLLDRSDEWSGSALVGRWTNQTHREWVYRQAFEMGRHIIGYEVAKIHAGIAALQSQEDSPPDLKLAVVGYGEGGLLALYAAALEPRVDVAMVSGYFQERQRVWQEPIYRNLFGLLEAFGDAEIASMIAPRTLLIEHAAIPEIDGPPPVREGRSGAAPGKLQTADPRSIEVEVKRARAIFPKDAAVQLSLETFGVDKEPALPFGSTPALKRLIETIGGVEATTPPPTLPATLPDPKERQRRQVQELVEHTQRLLRRSEYVRRDFWSKVTPGPDVDWHKACQEYRRIFWDEVIGRLPESDVPMNPRVRQIKNENRWIGYEVVLDVYPEVFAWGYLLVPKDLKAGERRPVVVCQHGLEGVPEDTVTTDTSTNGFHYYQGYASTLADRGFIVYAPHNPYRGQDKFRVLQRKLNPLGKSLFSVILQQHQRTLDWLATLPFVDSERIGFYGLSYGGKTAMRVPALLDGYALSICSADFNEWIRKNATAEDRHSYLFTGEYEMFEFNLGNTFNYAEMAALIAPRPFMVERGHHDGVAPDEWVAYEYAKVRRLYAELGIPEKTTIEFFNGPHQIHGVGTFNFLHQHLNWPKQ